MIYYNGLSRKGLVKSKNEDFYALPDNSNPFKIPYLNTKDKGFLFALCDGLGGHKAGDIASNICIRQIMADYYNEHPTQNPNKLLKDIIVKVNKQIYKLGVENTAYWNMGTTLVTALILNNHLFVHSIGDCRLYFYKKDSLKQITEDHTVVWEQFRNGFIKKSDIISSQYKHLLTKAIGLQLIPKFDSYFLELNNEWLILMTSDGIHDYLHDALIYSCILSSNTLNELNNILTDEAISKGSRDDISVISISNYIKP